MITYTTGDLFNCGADCLINTVNCDGYMGKGIAYQFKTRFPRNNDVYVKACKNGEMRIGRVLPVEENGILIINFPTKGKWREDSRIEYIETGMDSLVNFLQSESVSKVAIPPLGCGNGGLRWDEVKEVIESKLVTIENRFEFVIFNPSDAIHNTVTPARQPKMSASSLVVLRLKMGLKRATKLRLQKAAYMTNVYSGSDYFKFTKGRYGPYAHSIDIISEKIGEYQRYNGIADSSETYESISRQICSSKTDAALKKLSKAIETAIQYVNSVDTDEELEGLATALYLVRDCGCRTTESVMQGFALWSEEKASKFPVKTIVRLLGELNNSNIVSRRVDGSLEFMARDIKVT